MPRQPYRSAVDDETYLFMCPYLILATETSLSRKYPLREVLHAALWIARTGSHWAYLPHDFPPYKILHQQVLHCGCFENMVHDLRLLHREEAQRHAVPHRGHRE